MTRFSLAWLGVAALGAVIHVSGCGATESAPDDGGSDAAIESSAISDVAVDAADGNAADGSACTAPDSGVDGCDTCLVSQCCSELAQCGAGCRAAFDCVAACEGSGGTECPPVCQATGSSYDMLAACASTHCVVCGVQ